MNFGKLKVQTAMKIHFLPKTNLGKWSIGLIIAFFVLLGIFFLFIHSGERGASLFFYKLTMINYIYVNI